MNRITKYVYELIEQGCEGGTRSFPATDELPKQIVQVIVDGTYAETLVMTFLDNTVDTDVSCAYYD